MDGADMTLTYVSRLDSIPVRTWHSKFKEEVVDGNPRVVPNAPALPAGALQGWILETVKLYSEDELTELQSIVKRVTNPKARWNSKPGHRQRNFQIVAGPDDETRFLIYQRHSELDDSDFSCGIAFLPQGGARLTLARYNGPSHIHNGIEFQPHIHRATARAIAAGKKAESEAAETGRFTTLDGAFGCLLDDFRVKGITPPTLDQKRLL